LVAWSSSSSEVFTTIKPVSQPATVAAAPAADVAAAAGIGFDPQP
jgi:hypothetical protein